MSLEELVSVSEAARILGGISRWTVHSWLAQGRLRRVKIGSRTMLKQSDLERFIQKGEGAKSAAPRRSPRKS
jgi:excisionase family DNA binding protein